MTTKPLILAVDDEPDNLRLLSRILQATYRLRVATNGPEALERARTEPLPDLVLLDIMMPGMDGFQVCRSLKAQPETTGIPVIFITTRTDTRDIVDGFGAGGVDYLTKPICREELEARIACHLELKRNRERIEAQNLELIRSAAIRDDVDRILQHDLKGQLLPVLSLPDLLRAREQLSDKGQRNLEMISGAGDRMLAMIDLSLTLIKIERGVYEPNLQPVDLLAVVAGVVDGLEPLARKRSAAVEVLLDEVAPNSDDAVVMATEELLVHNLLTNLVKNALEASGPGAVVSIRVLSSEPVAIAIHNQQPVPAGLRDRFFDKYVTSGKPEGQGLGTYSALLMARALGVELGLETSDEAGTTVTATFPTESAGDAVGNT